MREREGGRRKRQRQTRRHRHPTYLEDVKCEVARRGKWHVPEIENYDPEKKGKWDEAKKRSKEGQKTEQ